jgi:uncharacterized membrane protein YgcG
MLIEKFLIEKLKGKPKPTIHPQKPEDKTNQNTKAIVLAIFNVILACIAGYLCWNCNGGEKPALRVIYTILATVFSGLYILFYFVYHVLIRVPCKRGSGSSSGHSSSSSSYSSSGKGNTIFD